MRTIKTVMISSIFVLTLLAFVGMSFAEADVLTKKENGIMATLKIDAPKNTVDLSLADLDTSKAITGAKVKALITNPGGRRDEKELMSMRMREVVSYMSTLDMSKKGRYIFDITAESGKRKAKFHFAYDVK